MKIYKTVLVLAAILLFSGQVLAAQGGKPAAHELSGKDWGSAVSGAAKEGGLGGHASGGKGGGKPAAHDLSGKDWGSAVSGAAKEGGLGGHASGKD